MNGKAASKYREFTAKKMFVITGLIVLIVLLAGLALTVGPVGLSIKDVLKTVMDRFLPGIFNVSEIDTTIIWDIRIPRIITDLLAGFGLALAGVQMQGILRNPLASPFTLGISSGAGFGAGLAVLTGITFVGGKYFLIGNAFIFALIPALVIFFLSRIRRISPGVMILAGISLSYVSSSGTALMSYFAQSEDLKSLYVWMMGNTGKTGWKDLAPFFIVITVSSLLLISKTRDLDIMNSGDETAKSLGIEVEKTRMFIMTVSSLITASVIGFTGMIGFVGLVAPHIMRLILGGDNRFLVPASALFGAAFLLGSDILAMKDIEPCVLPVGIIPALQGGPLFFILIIKRKGAEQW